MLVFALLTFIAELKEKQSVIFAMEEPEIALPPHTQRRVIRFSLQEMGQTIVTSHSPYVIEQFEPEQIVILNRSVDGALTGRPIDTGGFKIKTFKTEKRQFAEAVLSRAVLVVEGSTEAAIFLEASAVLERVRESDAYTHFDLAGVTIFDAGGDGSVPRFGPIFKILGKVTFGFFDKQATPLSADAQAKLGSYRNYWESTHKGIENLLVEEMKAETLRRFLEAVKDRVDYPTHHPQPASDMDDGAIKELAYKVLKDRKGEAHGYGALLIAECKVENDLPAAIRDILDKIQETLAPPASEAAVEATTDPAGPDIPATTEVTPVSNGDGN